MLTQLTCFHGAPVFRVLQISGELQIMSSAWLRQWSVGPTHPQGFSTFLPQDSSVPSSTRTHLMLHYSLQITSPNVIPDPTRCSHLPLSSQGLPHDSMLQIEESLCQWDHSLNPPWENKAKTKESGFPYVKIDYPWRNAIKGWATCINSYDTGWLRSGCLDIVPTQCVCFWETVNSETNSALLQW